MATAAIAPHPPIAVRSPVYSFPSPTFAHEPHWQVYSHIPVCTPTHSSNHSYSRLRAIVQGVVGAGSSPPSAYLTSSAQRQRRHSGTLHGHADLVHSPRARSARASAQRCYRDSSRTLHLGLGMGGGLSFVSGALGLGSQ